MGHHKRKRHKTARAGCLMCKPWKANRTSKMTSAQTLQERKACEAERLDQDDGKPVTGIICKVWGDCPHPELCQKLCWDKDLLEVDMSAH